MTNVIDTFEALQEETPGRRLSGSHPEVEQFLFENFGHHAALNYCGPIPRARFAWAYGQLSDVAAGDESLLDVGCGTGLFTLAAGNIAAEAVGVSVDEESLARGSRRAAIIGNPRVSFLKADATTNELKQATEGRQYDVVSCLEVIEHVDDAPNLVSNISSALKPGGHLILTTPNIGHIPLHDEFKLNQQPGGHVVYGYDREDLEELLGEQDFRILKVEGISGMGDHYLNNLSRRLTPRAPLGALALTSLLYPAAKIVDAYGLKLGFPPVALGVVAQKETR